MRAHKGLLGVGFAALAVAAVTACAAPTVPNGPLDSCADTNDSCGEPVQTHSHNDASVPPPSSPPPAAAPPKAPQDAGIDAAHAPPDAGKPPPTTRNCIELSSCCGSLSDFGDKIACIGVSLAGNETGCSAALAVCNGGGLGIGGLFQDDHPKCGALATCCGTLDADGYPLDAADCDDWVQIEDEQSCDDQLASYQSYGECL